MSLTASAPVCRHMPQALGAAACSRRCNWQAYCAGAPVDSLALLLALAPRLPGLKLQLDAVRLIETALTPAARPTAPLPPQPPTPPSPGSEGGMETDSEEDSGCASKGGSEASLGVAGAPFPRAAARALLATAGGEAAVGFVMAAVVAGGSAAVRWSAARTAKALWDAAASPTVSPAGGAGTGAGAAGEATSEAAALAASARWFRTRLMASFTRLLPTLPRRGRDGAQTLALIAHAVASFPPLATPRPTGAERGDATAGDADGALLPPVASAALE